MRGFASDGIHTLQCLRYSEALAHGIYALEVHKYHCKLPICLLYSTLICGFAWHLGRLFLDLSLVDPVSGCRWLQGYGGFEIPNLDISGLDSPSE